MDIWEELQPVRPGKRLLPTMYRVSNFLQMVHHGKHCNQVSQGPALLKYCPMSELLVNLEPTGNFGTPSTRICQGWENLSRIWSGRITCFSLSANETCDSPRPSEVACHFLVAIAFKNSENVLCLHGVIIFWGPQDPHPHIVGTTGPPSPYCGDHRTPIPILWGPQDPHPHNMGTTEPPSPYCGDHRTPIPILWGPQDPHPHIVGTTGPPSPYCGDHRTPIPILWGPQDPHPHNMGTTEPPPPYCGDHRTPIPILWGPQNPHPHNVGTTSWKKWGPHAYITAVAHICLKEFTSPGTRDSHLILSPDRR